MGIQFNRIQRSLIFAIEDYKYNDHRDQKACLMFIKMSQVEA